MTSRKLWLELQRNSPALCAAIDALTAAWLGSVLERLEGDEGVSSRPKTLNDAVWGTIELLPCEILLLDSPMLQRLRGIRQLGMAHLVYPGAGYDRLEHSLGVLEASQQILNALNRNARNRTKYATTPDTLTPEPDDRDRAATRLGALLHDVGHAPFSHATEHLIPVEFAYEFAQANAYLRGAFPDVTSIQPAEQMSALIVLSESLRKVIEHPRFGAGSPRDLCEAIAARILGSRKCLFATYLSGVVSGPLDADKIDYMARDSHHAGLPLGLDITRLVSKLEVVEVTTENAFNPELRARAEANGGRFFDLGLSRAGLGAFEQLIMARVMLYERLYYHHKVRAAEGMVRNLIESLKERGRAITLNELYSGFGDDTLLHVWGGLLHCDHIDSGGDVASRLATRIKDRSLLYRAYAFSSRFLSGLDGLPDAERDETQAILWSGVTRDLESFEGARKVAVAILEKARQLSQKMGRFRSQTDGLTECDIVVDLPEHSRVAKTTEILVSSEAGQIGTPNLFFNADKWANAYVHQKQCGYVFAPRHAIQVVALASRIVFFESFGVAMGKGADVAAKTHGLIDDAIYAELAATGLVNADCLAMLREVKPRLVRLRGDELRLPDVWSSADPNLADRLATELGDALTVGLPGTVAQKLVEALHAMLRTLQTIEQGGDFVKSERPDEVRELQPRLRDCLRAAGIKVDEAPRVGGGETDLVLLETIVLENKVLSPTDDPFAELKPAGWQARRYAIALSQRVRFICAAYKSKSESGILELPQRVRVRSAAGANDDAVEVQFVIPYGHGVPSKAGSRRSTSPETE